MTEAGKLIFDSATVSVRSLAVSEMENNVYLITAKSDGRQVLIDAADEFERINTFVLAAAGEDGAGELREQGDPRIEALITTHSHWDHIRALPTAVATYSPATYCGAADAPSILEQEDVQVAHLLQGGETLTFGDITLEVISLRGHTPGSIALVYQEPEDDGTPVLLFTGDSLFPGGVGKTDTPADFKQLLNDVRERIFSVFDDNTVVLPGHGQHTTLGADRGNIDEWEARGW